MVNFGPNIGLDPETVRYFDEPDIWAKVTGHYEKTVLERVTFDVF